LRILFQNARTGELKVQLESQDDVWHVYNVIDKDDVVTASTYRRVETKMFKDKLRPERGEKRKMTLSVCVEDTEYAEFSERLRVSGKIVDGPQDLGQHHTFNLEVGDSIVIRKDRWTAEEFGRIKEAVAASKRPLITFLCIDESEAVFAILRQAGLQALSTIVAHIPGKDYESDQVAKKREYYTEVLAELNRIYKDGALVILGPGFAKEEFVVFTREKSPDTIKNHDIRATGQSGLTGIHELLKTGIDIKLLQGQRTALEMQAVEKVLEEISMNGKYAYGPNEVRNAVNAGAVQSLLILDKLVRVKQNENLLRDVEKTGGSILVVSSSHEGGKKLEALGGIAAILRYKLQD
jgi:protein pelota